MMELDAIRAGLDGVWRVDESTEERARASLRRAMERERTSAQRRHGWLRFTVAAAVVSVVVGALALAVPRSGELAGAEVASAATEAIAPQPGVIVHLVVTARQGSSRWREQTWIAGGPTIVVHAISTEAGGLESEISSCGTITYQRRLNLLVAGTGVLPRRELLLRSDPASWYLAYGTPRSTTEITFRGIPAYRLRLDANGTDVDYLVRRDTYEPLRIAVHSTPAFVRTYTRVERIPRTKATEYLLHIRAHPGAFLLGGRRPWRGADCRSFATFDSLTGDGTQR